MNLSNISLSHISSFDMRLLSRLLFFISVCIILFSGSCATIEPGLYNDGPYIVSTYPSTGDFNISRYTDISIRFSEVMDPGTEIGFDLLAQGVKIDGTLRWLDSNTVLVFRPYNPLTVNTFYQCIIKQGRSKEGKHLVGVPYVWMFTTGN